MTDLALERRARDLWRQWLDQVRHLPADRADTWGKVGATLKEHFREEARK